MIIAIKNKLVILVFFPKEVIAMNLKNPPTIAVVFKNKP